MRFIPSATIKIGWLFVERATDEANIRIATVRSPGSSQFLAPLPRAIILTDTASRIPDARRLSRGLEKASRRKSLK